MVNSVDPDETIRNEQSSWSTLFAQELGLVCRAEPVNAI